MYIIFIYLPSACIHINGTDNDNVFAVFVMRSYRRRTVLTTQDYPGPSVSSGPNDGPNGIRTVFVHRTACRYAVRTELWLCAPADAATTTRLPAADCFLETFEKRALLVFRRTQWSNIKVGSQRY